MIEQVRQRVFLTVESYYLCPAEPRLPLALVASNLNHGTGLVRKPVIGFLSRSPTITTVEAAPPPHSSVTPKFVSPSDPAAQWTGAMRGPAFFAYADNYLIDVKFGIIMDVEASRALPILLQKSFCTGDQNFFWLYTRLSCKYVGDLIA
jgi:hypothetical protein